LAASDIIEIIRKALKILNSRLDLKDVLKSDEYLYKQYLANINNILKITIYDDNQNFSSISLAFNPNDDTIVEVPTNTYTHEIIMHEDTFLALVFDDITPQSAYSRGLIVVRGENPHVHAILLNNVLDRFGKLIDEIKPEILKQLKLGWNCMLSQIMKDMLKDKEKIIKSIDKIDKMLDKDMKKAIIKLADALYVFSREENLKTLKKFVKELERANNNMEKMLKHVDDEDIKDLINDIREIRKLVENFMK